MIAKMEQDEIELLSQIAILYYQKHATQQEISKKFSLSRIKVGRMLKKARDEGIVDININYHPIYSADLEEKLKNKFNLQRAIIVLDQSTDEEQRMTVGSAVSNYLSNILNNGMVIAVGQGRNISAVANHSASQQPKDCTFVAAVGGTHPRGGQLNADHICREFAKKYNGKSESLYAPAYITDKNLYQLFVEHKTIKETLDVARKANIGLVGIGNMSENSDMVDLGWFSKQEAIEAKLEHGIIGEMAGDFFNIQGDILNINASKRVIGLSAAEYKQIPCVIGIAAESSKSLAILGALRTKSIDILATSVSNATELLYLAR